MICHWKKPKAVWKPSLWEAHLIKESKRVMSAGEITPFQQYTHGHSLPWTLASSLLPAGAIRALWVIWGWASIGITSDELGLSLQHCQAFPEVSQAVFMTTGCPHMLPHCCCRSKGHCIEKHFQKNSHGGGQNFFIQRSDMILKKWWMRYSVQIISMSEQKVLLGSRESLMGSELADALPSGIDLWFGQQTEKMQNCPLSIPADFIAVSEKCHLFQIWHPSCPRAGQVRRKQNQCRSHGCCQEEGRCVELEAAGHIYRSQPDTAHEPLPLGFLWYMRVGTLCAVFGAQKHLFQQRKQRKAV